MKKLALFSLVTTIAATAYAVPAMNPAFVTAADAANSSGAVAVPGRSSGLDCRSGEICALVCSVKGNTEYSLYEFAHYQQIDGFFTRVIQPDTSLSQETQIQAAGQRLGKVDPALQAEFMKNVKNLKLGSTYVWGKLKKNSATPEEKLQKAVAEKERDPSWTQDKTVCISQKVAGFSQRLNAFQVNQKVYEGFTATDRAGLKSRMALLLVGRSKNVGPEHLMDFESLNRRIFYTESDVRILAKIFHKNQPTSAQLQNGIRYRVSLIFPSPTLGVKQLDGSQISNTFKNLPSAASANTTVAMNNWNTNVPANIVRGSDVGVAPPIQVAGQTAEPQPQAQPQSQPQPEVSQADIQNGYNVPQINLPPDLAAQANMNFAAANNGVPLQVQPEVAPPGFGENGAPVAAPAVPEVDPNTNNFVQGQPAASAR